MAKLTRLKAALVTVKSKLAGSVERFVQNKLEERVSILDFFGADPTGVMDSSDALQRACDVACHVDMPEGRYRMDKSIVVKNNVEVEGVGNPQLINRAMTFIVMNGNFPFMTNWQEVGKPNSMVQIRVKKLFIQYNPVDRPEVSADNSNKIAFRFYSTVAEANGLEFSVFEDIVVLGAWAAYWDSTGTYMTRLTRFEARNCRAGFLKSTGTTMILEHCYVNGCIHGYQFGAMSTVKMLACAIDNTAVSLAKGSYGGAGIHFTSVRAFHIDILDMEVNRVSADGGGIASLIHIENSIGSITNVVGLHNDLVSEGATPTGSVALVRLSNNSRVKFDGFISEFFDEERPSYDGSGFALTVLTDETSYAHFENSNMKSPGKKAGSTGTPQVMALSQGNVSWGLNNKKDGLVIGGTSFEAKNGTLFADSFATSKGSQVLAANVVTPVYTLPSKGTYMFSAFAEGSGVNFASSANIIFDGSTPAVFKMLNGAFLTIDASGSTVTLKCSGATTVQWSCIKVQ